MGNQKDLQGAEAIEKMRKLIESEDICLFATRLEQLPLDVRPMSTGKVDDKGNIWFLSPAASAKNSDIQQDNRVQLFYSNKGSAEFLSIYGEATISKDRTKIHDLWTPIAKAWFTNGEDDPEVTAIWVKPTDAYYWDTKNNKMISLIKILSSVLTGKTSDDGVEGKMELNPQR